MDSIFEFLSYAFGIFYGSIEFLVCIIQISVATILLFSSILTIPLFIHWFALRYLILLAVLILNSREIWQPQVSLFLEFCQHAIGQSLHRWLTICRHGKYGQLFAAREDLLGKIIVSYLINLCDDMPPMIHKDFVRSLPSSCRLLEGEAKVIADALSHSESFRQLKDKDVELISHKTHELFVFAHPLNRKSGTIATVYFGVLCPKNQDILKSFHQKSLIRVAVKMKRYRAKETQQASLSALKWTIAPIEAVKIPTCQISTTRKYWKIPILGELGLMERFETLSKGIMGQLDFQQEKRNIERFYEINKDIKGLGFARCFINMDFGPDMIVSTWMDGKSLASCSPEECDEIRSWGGHTSLAKGFTKDAYGVGFFHADGHTGNILVDFVRKVLNIVDCGLMGYLDETARVIEQQFMNMLRAQDFLQAARHMTKFMLVDAATRKPKGFVCESLVQQIASVTEATIGRPDMSFSRYIAGVCPIIERNGFACCPEFTLFELALMACEGCLRKIGPQENFWQVLNSIEGESTIAKEIAQVIPDRDAYRTGLYDILKLSKSQANCDVPKTQFQQCMKTEILSENLHGGITSVKVDYNTESDFELDSDSDLE